MRLGLKFREQLTGALHVVQDELDQMISSILGGWSQQHNDTGQHGHITCDTISLIQSFPANDKRIMVKNGGGLDVLARTGNAIYPLIENSTTTLATVISGERFVLANTARLNLGGATRGLLVVYNLESEALGMFQLRGSSGVGVSEISDPQGLYSTALGTASSTNVAYSSTYLLENNIGGSRTYRLTLISF